MYLCVDIWHDARFLICFGRFGLCIILNFIGMKYVFIALTENTAEIELKNVPLFVVVLSFFLSLRSLLVCLVSVNKMAK